MLSHFISNFMVSGPCCSQNNVSGCWYWFLLGEERKREDGRFCQVILSAATTWLIRSACGSKCWMKWYLLRRSTYTEAECVCVPPRWQLQTLIKTQIIADARRWRWLTAQGAWDWISAWHLFLDSSKKKGKKKASDSLRYLCSAVVCLVAIFAHAHGEPYQIFRNLIPCSYSMSQWNVPTTELSLAPCVIMHMHKDEAKGAVCCWKQGEMALLMKGKRANWQ